MTSSHSYAVKNALNEFLKRACEIARGETQRCINVFEIWNDTFPIEGLNREHYLPIILESLKESNFIENCNNENEIRVTFKGIYYAIDALKVNSGDLGVLSHEDIKRLENTFIKTLYDLTNGDTTRSVSIHDIQKRGLGGLLGTAPIRQISEYLKMKGLIETVGSQGLIKIPSKPTKKYYPASGPSFSSESFSSESFDT